MSSTHVNLRDTAGPPRTLFTSPRLSSIPTHGPRLFGIQVWTTPLIPMGLVLMSPSGQPSSNTQEDRMVGPDAGE